MNIERRLSANSFLFFLGAASSRLLVFITFLLISNYMGKEYFGNFTYATVYIGLIAILLDFCSEQILTRELSKEGVNREKLIGTALILKTILVLSAVLAAIAFNVLLYRDKVFYYFNFIMIFVLLFSVKVQSFKSVFDAVCKARYKAVYSIINDVIFHVVFLIVAIASIYLLKNKLFLIWGYALCGIPGLFYIAKMSGRFVKPDWKFDTAIAGMIIKESAPLLALSVLFMLSARMDIFMIEYFRGADELGLYSVIYRLCEPLNFIPVSIIVSLLPFMTKVFQENRENAAKVYRMGLKAVMVVSVPTALFISGFAEFLIRIPYKAEFYPAAAGLSVYIFTIIFGFASVIANNLLIAIGRQIYILYIFIAAVIVNFTLNIFFIPAYGFIGAAMATLITEAVVCLSYLIVTREFLHGFERGSIAKLLIYYGAMAAAFIILRPDYAWWAVSVTAVMPVLLVVSGYFNNEEMQKFRNVFSIAK